MYIHDADPILDRLTIHYVVPHTSSDLVDASPFQLISPGIIETTGAFDLIARLPRDATELVQSADELVAARMAGRGLVVLPLPTNLLSVVLPALSTQIVVTISVTEEIASAVDAIITQCSGPVLHVRPTAAALDRQVVRDHCLRVAEFWKTRPGHSHLAETLCKGLVDWKDPIVPTKLDFQDRNHLLTEPNVATLASAGYFPRPWDGQHLVGRDNRPYFDALKASVEPIVRIRNDLTERHPVLAARSRTDLILTVPGVTKAWVAVVHGKKLHDDPKENKLLRSALRQIVARETYNFSLEVPDGTSPQELLSSGHLTAMMHAHREDLGVYSAVLSIRSASSFAPVLRLPPSPNGSHNELSQLAAARRADTGRSPHKLNRLARALSDRLARGLPEWIIQHVRDASRIKLVSDAPLEWLGVDGFPLMLRADVSRIPVTPGNLFVQTVLRCTEVAIPCRKFNDVLIVRSFHPDDPIRPMIERSLEVYASGAERFPNVRIVDVRTRDDLIGALDGFDGAILVYDGHGAHRSDSDEGELVLVDERVDPWTLRGDVRVPPIVVLAACDTHPFDASHATSANGFLAAGAMTVLGTSVPVGGMDAAVFVGRLLLRVGAYLPLLVERRPWRSFRWSEILPGLQRRQYTTEALRRLSHVGGVRITEAEMINTMMDVGMAIDTGGDWLSMLIDRVSGLASCSTMHAREKLSRHAGYVDVLAYTQLGNPELVVGYAEGQA